MLHFIVPILLLSSDGGVASDELIERPEKPDHFEGYRPSYFLFGDNEDQVLFQFSFRYNIWPTDSSLQVFFGYTQRSWWELYDFEDSSPFVENNYSPELMFRWRYRTKSKYVEGFDQLQFGYQHQSNGEDGDRSRGWDRIYVEQRFVHYFGKPALSTPSVSAYLRLWAIFALDPFNEDIADFAGPGELIVNMTSGDTRIGRVSAELLLRKGGYNLRFDNGSIQAGLRWLPAWPPWVKFTPGIYLQGFFGTFQSLERYNIRDDAIRVGVYFES